MRRVYGMRQGEAMGVSEDRLPLSLQMKEVEEETTVNSSFFNLHLSPMISLYHPNGPLSDAHKSQLHKPLQFSFWGLLSSSKMINSNLKTPNFPFKEAMMIQIVQTSQNFLGFVRDFRGGLFPIFGLAAILMGISAFASYFVVVKSMNII